MIQQTTTNNLQQTSLQGSYIPSASAALGSLSRLSKRGISNIHRVKQSGKEYANKFYPSRLTSFSYPYSSSSKNNKNIKNIDNVPISPLSKNVPSNNNEKGGFDPLSYNENDSQISFESDATTLVNSGIDSSRHGSVSLITKLHSTSKIDTVSDINFNFSTPSRTSTSSTLLEKEVIFEEDERLILEPCPKIKEKICSFGLERAHELGKDDHLHYYQLPFPWRENRYIIYNYRFYDSHKKSFLSIINWYGWHNESTNIWTHLFGAIYMTYIAFWQFPNTEIYQSEKVPIMAKGIAFVFLLASIKCLLASTFWHTFNGTSFLGLRRRFACVDYSGITILITASILSIEFATLFSHPIAMVLFMFTSLVLGIIGIYLNCSPKFDSPEARPLRIKFFILLVAVGGLSFLQTIYYEGFHNTTSLLMPVTNKSIIWYSVGVVFYGSFIPERFRSDVTVDDSIPTQKELASDLNIITTHKDIHFRDEPTCNCHRAMKNLTSLWWVDYAFSSHTLWHFFVVMGAIGHYRAIIDIYTKRWLI
ncbi:similar to Saccharomyces cerevisiae YLR023C IZH3 Membrane protein involved in zinc ion homeostasis, member of the four-protein IZH family, expression induced by zinc deficiency [Maudiozyma saulgeensis]|uniref:Similar to Saccharomyces cerevisiae YLR023C IZH3 Membrane protein involved in zinc ion homeostasis, member of the four-protein IZH family, expression induced by zinc deficiency n=1 Tax=Maudiozyma saulgeensis TaxID=1789683 RepID=A0A1X7R8D0_9SACH|nr:similar to Saccharomyces cerevisiae YLR023C IZH3 Membrane protein involved in zinc ion homeostasis, member of the four-protein IZH family, expression induced by zinc deficiency [Kazachstania saulgeensis]